MKISCPTHSHTNGNEFEHHRVLAIRPISMGPVLLIGAEKCDTLLVRDILRLYPSLVDAIDEDGNTALAKAAWKGDWECVHILLTYGSDPNRLNHFGYTPIMHARKARHEYVLDMLQTSESVYTKEEFDAYEKEDWQTPRSIIQPANAGFLYIRTWGNFNTMEVDRLHALDDSHLTSSLLNTNRREVCSDVNGFDGDICVLRQTKESNDD